MAHRNPTDADSDPLHELRSIVGATIAESTPAQRALAFGFIPTLLLLVGALPLEQQHQWVLQLDDPTLIQLYLSNFVHRDISHLSNNILGYLLVMLCLFPLAASAEKQRILVAVSVLFITVLPFLVSVYSVATLAGTGAETVVGFSGVVAVYAGTLPFFIAYHANKKVAHVGVEASGTGLMGMELGIVLWFAGLHSWAVALLSVLGILGLLVAIRERRVLADVGRLYEVHLLVYGLIIFATVPITLLVSVDSGTNVYGHFVGLAGGFLLTLGVVLGESVVGRVHRSLAEQ